MVACRHNFVSSCVWRICHSIIPSVKYLLYQLKSHESLHFRDTLWLQKSRRQHKPACTLEDSANLKVCLLQYKLDRQKHNGQCLYLYHSLLAMLFNWRHYTCMHHLRNIAFYEQRSSVSLFFLRRQTNAYQELMSGTANKLLCLHTRTFFPCAIALWNNLPPFLQNSNSLQTIYCSNSFIIIVIVIVDLHVFHECFLLAD